MCNCIMYKKTKINTPTGDNLFLLLGIVLKPGLANPGLEPVQVLVKTRRGVGPVKPGRLGTRATRVNPTETWPFFLYIRSRFGLSFPISTLSQKPNREFQGKSVLALT